jgi:hypothetical protein
VGNARAFRLFERLPRATTLILRISPGVDCGIGRAPGVAPCSRSFAGPPEGIRHGGGKLVW